MTQAEAKKQIVELWKTWLQDNSSGKLSQDMLTFYANLKKQCPELLSFRAAGDKWQTVKMWIQAVY
ncbi:hypothetical protein [Comamonas sp. UBA7528]|uniref:hypothetical protein n=1 Tax=Comamonas sp. UBA7528 TaxID=1946391 RepID=UPI0025C0F9CA|nr:hypothetical protein [Comamonas sp. UBA7528]